MINKLKTGPWKLSDLKDVKKNGLNVLSCFSCGGGSTMGYKLAGFNVLGGVEIDPEMAEVYKKNHKPKYLFNMSVSDFNKIPNKELPKEFFELDILDGSPPCSSFSMAGSREKKWGKASKFREGQAVQVLDDLFFDYIETAKKLKPKVVVAENVKGMLVGNAKGYVKQIVNEYKKIGYDVQIFLLNAAFMGVPQRRERVFFIANRLGKKINLNFNEKPIVSKDVLSWSTCKGKVLSEAFAKWWRKTKPGYAFSSIHPKESFFNSKKLHPEKSSFTITSTAGAKICLYDSPHEISDKNIIHFQSFPDDYFFKNFDIKYICGMSVPPFMMQRIADQIHRQFFNG